MKDQIRTLLNEQKIDALLVTGAGQHNPAMVYLTGGAHLTHADLIFPRDHEPILFCGMMEREEAARSGLKAVTTNFLDYRALLQACNGDASLAGAVRYKKMLEMAGVTKGIVMIYGVTEFGKLWDIFEHLKQVMPELEIIGTNKINVLQTAMATKDENEVARIRAVGEKCGMVIERVYELLRKSPVKAGVLHNDDETPLRIGIVKKKINLWLAEAGLENPNGTIFAVGRDAGIPHSSGNANDLIEVGKTIVFDFFPCEEGGGYFHDFTRTWCIGHAPDEVLAAYEDVRYIYDHVVKELKPGVPFKAYQQLTCKLFEDKGHVTIEKEPAAEEGYIHSLGHGVGLNIHETPFSGATASDDDQLRPGSVFTIEPGLYYPSKGFGIRLEDTYYSRDLGVYEKFFEFPLDLVIKKK